jgi:phosphohistidine phosphatase
MALFLVQHGKSLSKAADPEQGLSKEGIAQVELIAGVARGYGVRPLRIRHSVKKRARQTAELFAAALDPTDGIEEITGIKAMDDVEPVAKKLKATDHMMLVGHLPFMERLTAHLITGTIAITVFKFQNGGIVCLDQDPEGGNWFIKWTLMPTIS